MTNNHLYYVWKWWFWNFSIFPFRFLTINFSDKNALGLFFKVRCNTPIMGQLNMPVQVAWSSTAKLVPFQLVLTKVLVSNHPIQGIPYSQYDQESIRFSHKKWSKILDRSKNSIPDRCGTRLVQPDSDPIQVK